MRKTILAAAALSVLLVTPALASHCPKDIKAIDAALTKVKLSAADKAKVKALRDEGEALHKAKKHRASVDKLSEAMRIILNKM